MKKEIEEKVKSYYEAKVALDFQKAQLENLGKELKEALQQEGVKKETTSNGYEVSLTSRTTIKYKDELALKDYLKIAGPEYIVESIDSKKLNADIKNSDQLKNNISKYLDISTVDSLTVKEGK